MRDKQSQKIVQRVYPVLQPRAQVSLKRGSRLRLLKSTFNTDNFYAVCSGLTLVISAQFTLEVEVTARNRKKRKSIKSLFCCSMSSKVNAFGTKRKRV